MKAILCDACGNQGFVPFDEDLRVSVRLKNGLFAAFDLCLDCQNDVRSLLIEKHGGQWEGIGDADE